MSLAPTTIILLRHGQSIGNIVDNRLINNTLPEYSRTLLEQGDAKWPLTELGKQQAKRAGILLRRQVTQPINYIFCSPFIRSQETLQCLDAGPGILEPLLQEQSWGSLNGSQILDQIPERQTFEQNYPHNIDLRPPEGETIREVYYRVQKFWKERRGQMLGKTTLVVSHWAPLFLSRMVLNDIPIEEFSSTYFLKREILNCQMDIYSLNHPDTHRYDGWWNCSFCMEIPGCQSYPWQKLQSSEVLP